MATSLNFTSSKMNAVKNSAKHSKIPSNLPNFPSACALPKRRRARNPNIEESLPSRNSHAGPELPNPRMGQIVTTMRHHIKSSVILTSPTQSLSICSYFRQLQLQTNFPRPTRHRFPRQQDNRTARHLCTTRSQRLVHWPFTLLLPMLQLLHTINSRHTRRNLSGLVSTPNPFSQSHNGRLLNPDRQGHISPHRTKTSTNQIKTHPLAHVCLKATKRLHINGQTPSACL